jgi:hypothetical protein
MGIPSFLLKSEYNSMEVLFTSIPVLEKAATFSHVFFNVLIKSPLGNVFGGGCADFI